MRMFGVAVLAIVSLSAAVRSLAADGGANEEAAAKELQTFKGTWRLSSREEDGFTRARLPLTTGPTASGPPPAACRGGAGLFGRFRCPPRTGGADVPGAGDVQNQYP
jgi:hypothetical protein